MNCFRRGCNVQVPPGIIFCPGDWARLPRHVRNFIIAEQKAAHRARREPGKKWEVTIHEAIEFLHGLDLEESFARAKPLTLTADKSWLGKLADQVLGRSKDLHKMQVVVHPIAKEPMVDGDRVFCPSVESLRQLLLASERTE